MALTDWARVFVSGLVCLGMLVVVPLGLRLVDGDVFGGRRWVWFAGAVPGAASLWLPRGPVAAGLAGCYLLAALALLAGVPGRLRPLSASAIAVCTALAAPTVAAAALVAERAGYRLLGFRLDVLALTEAHLHYAGFTAALVAGLVARHGGAAAAGRAAALAVPGGTALVLAGFFLGDGVELAGAAVLTVGMWLAAWITVRTVGPGAPDPVTRGLFLVSGLVLAATMVLALDWAAGHVTDVPHLSASWMAPTHGVANALGFALCSVLAWRRLARYS